MSEASEAGQDTEQRPDGRQVVRPTAGERARTLAYGVADGVLAVPGVPYAPVPAHATDEQGRPLLLLPARSAAVAALRGEPDLPATLRISDVAPVPLADRVRGRAWLHGWVTEPAGDERRAAALRLSRLHPRPELLDIGPEPAPGQSWTVLALEIAEVEIRDAWGEATLDPEEYEAGVPDPLVAIEAGILSHLDECHRAELVVMLRRLNDLAARVSGGGVPGVPAAREPVESVWGDDPPRPPARTHDRPPGARPVESVWGDDPPRPPARTHDRPPGARPVESVWGDDPPRPPARTHDRPPGARPVVRPLGLDRYGMWLRCFTAPPEDVQERPDGAESVDLRVVFGEPVSDIHGLRRVYRRLFAGVHS
nr:hypothetical protein GCM10010200_028210 [Actinomadura rugatobispora]